jgi:hypothetical protein
LLLFGFVREVRSMLEPQRISNFYGNIPVGEVVLIPAIELIWALGGFEWGLVLWLYEQD